MGGVLWSAMQTLHPRDPWRHLSCLVPLPEAPEYGVRIRDVPANATDLEVWSADGELFGRGADLLDLQLGEQDKPEGPALAVRPHNIPSAEAFLSRFAAAFLAAASEPNFGQSMWWHLRTFAGFCGLKSTTDPDRAVAVEFVEALRWIGVRRRQYGMSASLAPLSDAWAWQAGLDVNWRGVRRLPDGVRDAIAVSSILTDP